MVIFCFIDTFCKNNYNESMKFVDIIKNYISEKEKKVLIKTASLITVLFLFSVGFAANAWVRCPSGNWDNSTGVCIPTDTGLPEGGGGSNPVSHIINGVMLWLLQIIGFIAIIAFVVSGIQYLTSAGDEGQIETAKRNMKWSIVGVIVALIGYIIIVFVNNMLGGTSGNGWSSNSGSSFVPTSSNSSSNTTWINPDTGKPYTDSSDTVTSNRKSDSLPVPSE